MRVMFRLLAGLVFFLWLVNIASAENTQRSLQKIIASGELRVGTSLFPLWVMRAKDGRLIGSEIDMANRLAKDIKLKPILSLYEFNKLISALENN
jgi:ABC-type amino acid transport substrate-binding protein